MKISFDVQLKVAGIPMPRTEYEFHPERDFRFDYAWPDHKVALESDGGIFGKGKKCELCGRRRAGAHSSIKDILRNMDKGNEAAILGWKVLHVTPDELVNGHAQWLLERAMLR